MQSTRQIGADRGTLAFLCEAYHEDHQPDEKGEMQERVVMKFHPRLAPVKAAVFPLIKKEGMPEKAAEIYGELKAAGLSVNYDQQAARVTSKCCVQGEFFRRRFRYEL
ncbi:MAG: hypothetical protein NT138_19510 [Planctomycetales bacterium]|nr:hypothetical protein [Planctomycetales bacterium]